jgi:hypothetical protein
LKDYCKVTVEYDTQAKFVNGTDLTFSPFEEINTDDIVFNDNQVGQRIQIKCDKIPRSPANMQLGIFYYRTSHAEFIGTCAISYNWKQGEYIKAEGISDAPLESCDIRR